ncbi:MAG: hypothetical protein ACYTF1_22285, partial [Planctomycetota bacterium]
NSHLSTISAEGGPLPQKACQNTAISGTKTLPAFAKRSQTLERSPDLSGASRRERNEAKIALLIQ